VTGIRPILELGVRVSRRSVHTRVTTALATSSLVVLSLMGTPAYATAPRTTRAVEGYDIDTTHSTQITTSTGKHLDLDLNGFESPPGCPDCGDPSSGLTLTLSRAGESHGWDMFAEPNNPGDPTDIVAPTGSTPGTIDTRSDFEGFGRVQMSITPVGSAKSYSCSNGTVFETNQKVTLSGTIFFETRSSGPHAWGTLGTRTAPTPVTLTANLETDYNTTCQYINGNFYECQLGTNWTVNMHNGVSVGSAGSKKTRFHVARDVLVGADKDIQRFDNYTGPLGSATFTRSGHHATVKIKGRGGFSTGTGTIQGTTKGTKNVACGFGHTKVKVTIAHYKSTYRRGAHPFTVHPQVFGTVKITGAVAASIDTMHKR
jgi:hypothetical protein